MAPAPTTPFRSSGILPSLLASALLPFLGSAASPSHVCQSMLEDTLCLRDAPSVGLALRKDPTPKKAEVTLEPTNKQRADQ